MLIINCVLQIYVTQDFGASWSLLASYTQSMRWAYLEAHPTWAAEDAVVFTRLNTQTGDQYSHRMHAFH